MTRRTQRTQRTGSVRAENIILSVGLYSLVICTLTLLQRALIITRVTFSGL